MIISKDKEGNTLFIMSRSPYKAYGFVNILLQLSLKVYNLMYLEDGPEVSFCLNHNGINLSVMGSYETGFNENDDDNQILANPKCDRNQ
ncbi:hypothetical protein GCM10022393_05290 [Aquimarina addita]|uniref:Uncharacterized protein n=1 Tax=Aquimarina addita TaxID=870485 RepID=A0ABP7XAR0_9FLAO